MLTMTSATILAVVLLAQRPAAPALSPNSPRDEAAERLKFMKDSVTVYDFAREAGPLALQAEPAFRLGKQGDNNVLEGAIFVWKDADGRPEAAAQVFLLRTEQKPEGQWLHEFSSLSTGTFTASAEGVRRWWPESPGVAYQTVPGAPAPAASPAARLRQMRAIAQAFKAEDDFGNRGTYETLRLLTTPVARYGKAGGTVEDGALFAFVEGTDPEVFLFLEVRKGAGGPEWQYGLAPMSCWPLKARYKDSLVWNLPLRDTGFSAKPFFCRTYLPSASEERGR